MATEQGSVVDGALIQGDGGAMYFVPATELENFRLADDMAGEAQAWVDEVSGASEVSGFNFGTTPTVQAAQPRTGQQVAVKFQPAFYGPIGVKIGSKMSDDPTASYVTDVREG